MNNRELPYTFIMPKYVKTEILTYRYFYNSCPIFAVPKIVKIINLTNIYFPNLKFVLSFFVPVIINKMLKFVLPLSLLHVNYINAFLGTF